MEVNSGQPKKNFQILMALASLIAFLIFLYHSLGPILYHVFSPDAELPVLSENAIYWFLLSLSALIFPYISEITFKDFHVLFKEMKASKQLLVTAKNELEEARLRFDKTREELILGYFEYLRSLPAEKQIEKKIYLTKLYLESMSLTERELMEMLNNISILKCDVSENLTADTLEAIEQFQKNFGLIPDGVFGYQTYAKLLETVK